MSGHAINGAGVAPAAAGEYVIEQAIYFALGCIVTALGALMFAPVFWSRALRITRKRLQLQIPLSMQEIYAERDQLRAAFAVERLRLEQEIAGVRSNKTRDMAEIGRRSMAATRLADELAAAQETERALGTERDALKHVLSERDAEMASLRQELHDAREEAGRMRLAAPEATEAVQGAASPGSAPAVAATSLRHVQSLEQALAATSAALADSREREKGLHLLNSLKAERERSADRHAAERLEATEAENAALHDALRAAQSGSAGLGGPADRSLRDSIHALGVAVAAMTRDARRDAPTAAPASKDEVQAAVE